jgi:hypothetical protein
MCPRDCAQEDVHHYVEMLREAEADADHEAVARLQQSLARSRAKLRGLPR